MQHPPHTVGENIVFVVVVLVKSGAGNTGLFDDIGHPNIIIRALQYQLGKSLKQRLLGALCPGIGIVWVSVISHFPDNFAALSIISSVALPMCLRLLHIEAVT